MDRSDVPEVDLRDMSSFRAPQKRGEVTARGTLKRAS